MKPKQLALLLAALSASMTSLADWPSAVYAETASTAQIVKSVSFRERPSTTALRIRYLSAGEEVQVLSRYNDYWLKVQDRSGTTGYVSDSPTYVKLSENPVEPAPEPPTASSAVTPNAEVISSVSFRTAPSTSSARIRYLRAGELLTIQEKVNSYWYKASDASGTIGYVSTNKQYIDSSFEQQNVPEEAFFIDKPNATILASVSFRTAPSTGSSRIRYLKTGEQVLVLDKTNAYWYYVQDQTGTVGYVSTGSSYIRTTYTEPYKSLDRPVAIEQVIAAGMKYIGTPYEFGSSRYDTSTFDCSDFTRQAFLDGIGLRIPGDSRSQGAYIQEDGAFTSDLSSLKRGDLLFFMAYKGYRADDYAAVDRNSEKITHVGIYLGEGKMLHTYSQESGGVRIDDLAGSQWEYRFLFGGSAF